MAGELGAFPGFAKNRDGDAAGHPQPPPRRAWRDRRLRGAGDPAGAARRRQLPGPARWSRRRSAAWDAALALGEKHGFRNAQATRDRADRHDRPGDGLRHDRHRARFRAGQVQEARRRRLFQDHQPRGAAGAARTLGYGDGRDRRDRALCASATARSTGAPGDQPRDARRPRASTRQRSPPSRRRSPPPSTSSSRSTNGRWARRSASRRSASPRRSWPIRLRPAGRARLLASRDRGRQHLLLRRDDAGRRAAPEGRSTCRSSIAPTRAAASASAASRSTATSA